jgi:hypothetical protein
VLVGTQIFMTAMIFADKTISYRENHENLRSDSFYHSSHILYQSSNRKSRSSGKSFSMICRRYTFMSSKQTEHCSNEK